MYPNETEMWNVVVQYLFREHNFSLTEAKKSADNVRANNGLEMAYDIAQKY